MRRAGSASRRVHSTTGLKPMLDNTLLFLAVVAALGAGGVLGLISLVVMAIEIATED